jgi:hypothetical protein
VSSALPARCVPFCLLELTLHSQSHTWPSTITYPPTPTPTESYTATMIPVSHLAREGFTPAAMGMVLCDDANISQYVSMVQGLHAEGVVRPHDPFAPIYCAPCTFLLTVIRHSACPSLPSCLSSFFPPNSTQRTPSND